MLGLDPRTHLVALCAIGACSIVAIGIATTAALQAVAAVYLAANGHARLAARSCVGFCAIAALSLIPLPGLYGVLFVSLMHMTPPFTAGLTLFALSPSAIMGALARWRVPRKAMAAVCMAFRFAALLPQEARAIASGIRMRGVFARGIDAIVHPALAYECLYTPLVMRVLRLSSELAASAELRGIEANGRRTSLHHTGFEVRDALCSACVVALPVAILALEAMAS